MVWKNRFTTNDKPAITGSIIIGQKDRIHRKTATAEVTESLPFLSTWRQRTSNKRTDGS